jgi:hypothetical protein
MVKRDEQGCEILEPGEEGIKLLIKGKLKNIPEFSFKKPKTEKEKLEAEAKKEAKKETKKNDLNVLIDQIEKNFEKFQTTKKIAQQQTQQQIPIYIPQYTPPQGKQLNTQNLTEINNMILEKENEIKEYYETKFNLKWSNVEDAYNLMEQQVLEEDREIAFREPVLPTEQSEQPTLPIIRPVPQPPSIIDNFELLQKPAELTPSQDFEQETTLKSFADNVVDILGIFDEEMLNKFKNANNKTETLEAVNKEQQTIIDSKQSQLNQLNETIELMNDAVNLSKNEIDKLEKTLIDRINEIKTLTDQDEKNKKIKEAEILSLQLNSAEDVNELQEQLKLVKQERDETKNELETLKLLNADKNEKDRLKALELLDKIRGTRAEDDDENISVAERELLNIDPEIFAKKEFLSNYIPDNKVPTNKQRLKTMYDLFNDIIKERGEEVLRNRINAILFETPTIKQTDFIKELSKERENIVDMFNKAKKEEEARQRQILDERVREAENEEKIEILNQIDIEIKKITDEFNKINVEKEKKLIKSVEYKEELDQLIQEYEGLLLTLDKAFEDAGINGIEDIENIEDEDQKNTFNATFEYINDTKNDLQNMIEDLKDFIIKEDEELRLLDIELFDKEDQIKTLKKKKEIVDKQILNSEI